MRNTRETTPDVELLKSPEEITIWSLENVNINENVESEVDDYYWEDEEQSSCNVLNDDDADRQNNSGESRQQSPVAEEASEVFEVYESKYGRNEDFAAIQREVANQKPQKQYQQKPPAICCNVM